MLLLLRYILLYNSAILYNYCHNYFKLKWSLILAGCIEEHYRNYRTLLKGFSTQKQVHMNTQRAHTHTHTRCYWHLSVFFVHGTLGCLVPYVTNLKSLRENEWEKQRIMEMYGCSLLQEPQFSTVLYWKSPTQSVVGCVQYRSQSPSHKAFPSEASSLG